LVIQCHQHHQWLPTHWEELREVYGDGQGLHHGGLSFAEIREHMVMEFARLPELEAKARDRSSPPPLPEIIYPRSGRQAHGSGAEPNELVGDYLRAKLPLQ
jgi:hypothetical protein